MTDRPQKPALGPISLFALGLNGIVGVGIFVAPPIVARALRGTGASLLYVAVALGCVPVALVYARLARAIPKDGGPVLWAERAFGARAAGAVGVLIWVSSLFSASAVTRALGDLTANAVHRPKLAAPVAVGIVVVLGLVNLRGLRLSALAWTALTAFKIAPLVVVAWLGLLHARVQGEAFDDARLSFGRAALAILFSLQGFEIVALPAGQAKNAGKVVPRATVAALVVAGILYAAIHYACVVALPSLGTSTDPIPETARVLGGPNLARGVALGVVASIAGIVVGMHAMTPRYLTAVTAPEKTMTVDRRAIVVSGVAVAVFASIGSLGTLVDLSSASVLAQYFATCAALIALAWQGSDGLRPRDAWPAPIALVVVLVLLSRARPEELLVAGAVAFVGAAAAAVLRRIGTKGA